VLQPQRIGKYDVLETIGHGGFSTVFKARDPFLKRTVAIKFCSVEDDDLRRRFLREAEIAGTLDHPSIVRTFDCGFTDEGAYLVQEFLDGEDLRQQIQARAAIPYPARTAYLLEIAEALRYAHSKGVLHRDVKPANVRVLSNGGVKILDFGIGKLTGGRTVLTKEGTLLGTAGYLPPEQALGRDVDERSDVFGFGALAYELLTFRKPFPGDSLAERIRGVLESSPDRVKASWYGCPPALDALVSRCLEKPPEQRYKGFADLIRDLTPIHRELVLASEVVTIAGPLPLPLPPPPDPVDAIGTGLVENLHVLEAQVEADRGASDAQAVIAMAAAQAPVAPDPAPTPVTAIAPDRGPAYVAPVMLEPQPARVAPVLDSPAPKSVEPQASADELADVGSSASPARPGRSRVLWLAAASIFVLLAVAVVWRPWASDGEEAATRSEEEASDPSVPSGPVRVPVVPADTGLLIVDAQPWGEIVGIEGASGEPVAIPEDSATPLKVSLGPGQYRISVARDGSVSDPVVCAVSVEAAQAEICRLELSRVSPEAYFGAAGWWP
jgi:serine/threonine-protein kinase